MPSFLHQAPLSNPNPMGTEGSRVPDYAVLEQYMGFRVGNTSNNIQGNLMGHGSNLQTGTYTKGQFANHVSGSGTRNENWGESNMDSASHTDNTSSDEEPNDKTRRFEMGGQSNTLAISDSSDKSKEKPTDQKTLRRLAQNREAARKSRLRKKAYIQQLESSRLKLTQLEQELQRARQHANFNSTTGDQTHTTTTNNKFDSEYIRWLEEHNRHINELRLAINAHAIEPELVTVLDNAIKQFNEVFIIKGVAAKVDVFHIMSGMWKTPAERCFMWIGGFRPSELLKLLVNHLEPLTDEQLSGIYNLQQSSNQAEDALSQGMDALQQSLSETLATGSVNSSGNVASYMGQMAMAMGKLGTLQGFVHQADNLRQQTLRQLHRVLTTRQSARALLAINEYFSRLRALSALWLARPRE